MGDRSRRRIWRSVVWAPLARHKRLVLATALVGLCAGAAVPLIRPPEAVATTSLILNHRADDEDPADAMVTDVSLATSRELAVRVVDRLGLRETPDELLRQYTAKARTDRVLELSARADSGAEAKRIVRTVGDQLLTFRVEQSRQRLVPLRKALTDARAEVAGLKQTAVPTLTTGGSDEDATRQRITAAQDRVDHMAEEIAKEEAANAPVARSLVLDPPTVRTPSQLALVGEDGAIGLAVGLGGMAGLVVMSGLLAYRPRPERELADVLAPPVEWEHEPAAPEPSYELDSAVAAVRRELAHGDPVRPTLALVPVGSVTAAASLAAAVAMRCAEDGDRVLLADLSEHGTLVRALGVADAGTSAVSSTDGGEAQVSVHRPASGEPRGRLGPDGPEGVDDELLIAWVLSDVVLTLVEPSPSPALGQLHTWAGSAAAVATGSRPPAARLRSVGELVRTGGVSLESVVVLDVVKMVESSLEPADVASPAADLVTQSAEAGR